MITQAHIWHSDLESLSSQMVWVKLQLHDCSVIVIRDLLAVLLFDALESKRTLAECMLW